MSYYTHCTFSGHIDWCADYIAFVLRRRIKETAGDTMEAYSVLMSVYHKEDPEYLHQSIQSVMEQTVKTNDFVLVCDGPLTDALDAVIASAVKSFGEVVRVFRLEENQGLKHALNYGLPLCKNELIARMDSDDICHKERCALQLACFDENPELGIVSGTVEEFEGSVENVTAVKKLPLTHEEIIKYSKTRSPFNHPCVMYRKSAVLAVGGYPGPVLYEDYALWVELLASGVKGRNLPDTLCYMRVDGGMYARRGGWGYLKKATAFRWSLYREKHYCSLWESIYSVGAAAVVALLPTGPRRLIYKVLLRK